MKVRESAVRVGLGMAMPAILLLLVTLPGIVGRSGRGEAQSRRNGESTVRPRLAPATELKRIAFGSCAVQDDPEPIWSKIAAVDPQLFLFIGDNIYGDSENMEVMRAKYAKLAAIPQFRSFHSRVPFLVTWDDHDYGLNDGGEEFEQKVASQKEFQDFWGVPADSPLRRREGVYDAAIFGPAGHRVQVILLDTRYHRSPLKPKPADSPLVGRYVADETPGKTMLGAAQWSWLTEQLRKPAEIRLIASSVQVVPEDHGWEKWMNFPRERERLYATIHETGANGVIFLSGDRHLAELSMMDGGVGYPLYDLTSSGMNNASHVWRAYEVNRHRVGTMNWGDNFGLVTIDWGATDPVVSLQIRDGDGDINIQRKIRLSTITAKRDK